MDPLILQTICIPCGVVFIVALFIQIRRSPDYKNKQHKRTLYLSKNEIGKTKNKNLTQKQKELISDYKQIMLMSTGSISPQMRNIMLKTHEQKLEEGGVPFMLLTDALDFYEARHPDITLRSNTPRAHFILRRYEEKTFSGGKLHEVEMSEFLELYQNGDIYPL